MPPTSRFDKLNKAGQLRNVLWEMKKREFGVRAVCKKEGNTSERKGQSEMHDDSNDDTESGNIPGHA